MHRRNLMAGAAAILLAPAARANSFPSGPFRIIVPFGAGSATDQGARNIAEGLNRTFGVPAVVENKPGANGAIAAEVAAKAKPDGQTIFVCSNTAAASNVAMMKSLPYDPVKDFEPVTLIGRAPVFLIVNPKV
jgi:tripartite-type tricarboxylate transporter receptor subunit TctC